MDSKTLTLQQWDEASNSQRQEWLDSGYMLNYEDGVSLLKRLQAKKENYRKSLKAS